MALLRYLDVMRLLERALRRSGLPVSYSGGFHSLPRLQIALALPLGVEAFGEWMDLDFYQSVEPLEIKQKLQKHVTNLSKYNALTRNSIRERSI